MFRYVLALLLINTSYQSLGAPTNSNATLSLAYNLLYNLSTQCKNAFLVTKIKSQLDYCSHLPSGHGDKQVRCYMFYDINSQLCQAVGEAKIALTQDYSDKINEEQDVNTLCVGAKEWTFTNITVFPRYKPAVDKVFKHPVACGNICGVEELMSDDANFFCKYYKWGSDLLKTAAITLQTGGAENAPIPNSGPVNAPILNSGPVNAPILNSGPGNAPILNSDPGNQAIPDSGPGVEPKPEISPENTYDLADVQIKNKSNTTIENVISKATSPKNSDVLKVEVKPESTPEVKPEGTSQVVSSNLPPNPPANADTVENLPSNNAEDPLLDPDNTQDNKDDDKETDVINPKSEPNIDALPKPETPENKTADNPLKVDVNKEIEMLNNELEKKEPVIDNPKDNQKNDPEDYPDSEGGKDPLVDMQGGDDDGDDSILEDTIIHNNKPEDQKPPVKKIDSSIVSPYTGDSEYYPNTIQDGFSDDEDHFFSFFLTAIIVVVLLYILYHNKSKFSKMFFGLILEGRQSNRRRNSRGHAYKRLDTLEQAMSTNSAAPPSKIIY